MKTKTKKFSRKLLALFMAMVMALTCFTGAMSAFAASDSVEYHDDYVEYNDLAWSVLSDEQAATALLDYCDEMLAEYGPKLDSLIAGALPSSGMYYYDSSSRTFELSILGIITASIKLHFNSVDEILETFESIADTLDSYSSVLGDAGNLQLGATDGMRRSNTSSVDIIQGILGILQQNSADYNGKDVLGEFLRGGFDLGLLESFIDLDIYGLIGDALGADDGYESNLVYNLVQAIIFNNTDWFTDEEIANYKDGTTTFVYDDVLLEKLSTELLQKINAEITYKGVTVDDSTTVSSKVRYEAIQSKVESDGITFREAASELGYDPDIVYTDSGNVYLFVYGTNDDGSAADDAETLSISKTDTLYDVAYNALAIAWKTVLADTISTIRVNYSVDRGHGSNFDNVYYYWAKSNIDGGWDTTDLTSMYSEANINAWAESAYESYGAESAEEFLGWVQDNYAYDRTADEDSTGSWDDIDETTLFNKLRYSPLADYGFNMETGPINLYFMQTGTANLNAFFEDEYSNYNSIVAGLNDALVAAVKDIFINNSDRPNVYGDNDLGTLATVNPTTIDSSAAVSIADTLVSNALMVVQYTADATDSNILKAFYDTYGESATLTESNLEEAMVPLLIACIGQINLNGYKMEEYIHPEDWDGCKDAEAVIYVALEEYLSYVLPDKDYSTPVTVADDGTITATLDGTILPMARDAVAYVMQGYVPIYDTAGEEFNVYDRAVDDSTTIFDILNSVICYYGGDYEFENTSIETKNGAMGVGALLGLCSSTDGSGTITTDNTIWENIDLVANHLFPVLGTLQYGDSSYYGKFSSEDLIYNDIIKGVLEISDTSIHDSGMGGVSNFIYRVVTIVSADPIQTTSVTNTIYDLVADLINALFGARYDGQGWDTIIPARSSDTPYDDVMQIGVLAGTSGDDVGAIQKLICNFVEFAGFGSSGIDTYPDSIMRGLMFAMKAVNSYVSDAITTMSDSELEMASADYTDETVTNCSTGGETESTITFTNNANGINSAYVDGMNDSVVQLGRYYIKITGTSVTSSTGSSASITSYPTDLIAPGESVTLETISTYLPDDTESTTFIASIYYDVYLDGEVIYSDLEANAYQYLTGAVSWQEVVYPDDRGGYLNSSLETDTAGKTTSVTEGESTYYAYTSAAFGKNSYLNVLYPEYLVITSSDYSAIENYQFRIRNTASNLSINTERSVDGFYCYDEATVYDDYTGANVTVDIDNAIPIFDTETGSLIKYGMYDYRIDGGDWQRNGTTGYTEEEVSSVVTANLDSTVETRDHVAYTIDEAESAGIIAAYHQNVAGVYEYVYMQTGNGTNYDTSLSLVSLRGPVDGIYINQGKKTVSKNSSEYTTDLFKYDGSTEIQAGTYDARLCFYNSTSSGSTTSTGSCTLVVGDDSTSSTLDSLYNELKDLLAIYRDADYTDISAKEYAQEALLNVLAAKSTVITPETALLLSDESYLAATTTTVTTEYGDAAYKPFSESNASELGLPLKVMAAATVGEDGYYYFDDACTMPIYSNVPLEASDVTDGCDPTGIEVIADDEGNYYLRNQPVYDMEWDTTTYSVPYQVYVTDSSGNKVQSTDSNGNLLYAQVTYVYRDSSGTKVNSTGDWYAKFPATSYECKENDGTTDYRGLYSQAADMISYALECVYASIDTTMASALFEQISLVRNQMNNNNFEVITYNKMVELAKKAEKNYTLNIPYTTEVTSVDADGNVTTETVSYTDSVSFSSYNSYMSNSSITVDEDNITVSSTLSSIQVEEYIRLFDIFMNAVVERGYNGNQLEAEILCASGNSYSDLTATLATYDDDGNIATAAAVTKSDTAAEPEFGAWSDEGTLENTGAIVYADNLWSDYVTALAAAVSIADEANTTYAYADTNYYVASAKDDYTCQVTDCYTADTNLQVAEIALEAASVITVAEDVTGGYVTIDGVTVAAGSSYAVEDGTTVTLVGVADDGYVFDGFAEEDVVATTDSDTGETVYTLYVDGNTTITPVFTESSTSAYTVSASLVVATNKSGDTNNVAVNGDYTITVYDESGNQVGDALEFASSYDDNTFSLSLDAGTYTLTVSSAYSLTREDITVIVTDSDISGAVIPIVACDYNGDGYITDTDLSTVYSNYSKDAPYCDLNGDTNITATDLAVVYTCYGITDLPDITIS